MYPRNCFLVIPWLVECKMQRKLFCIYFHTKIIISPKVSKFEGIFQMEFEKSIILNFR